MTTTPSSVRIDSDIFGEAKKHGINISQVLNETLRSMLENKIEDGYYSRIDIKLKEELKIIDDKLFKVESLYNTYLGRMNELLSERKSITDTIEINRKSYEDALIAERKSNLLRAINKAIVYHEYHLPDIQIAVATQLKELQQLSPEFNLERHIEYYKNI